MKRRFILWLISLLSDGNSFKELKTASEYYADIQWEKHYPNRTKNMDESGKTHP